MRGIIRLIATVGGVVMETLVVLAASAEVVAVLHFAPHSMARFLNFLLSHIQVTSIQMRAVLFVVLTFIFISLHMVAGFSLMILARRGRSILAPTIQLFGIILRLPKVARDF